MQQAGHKLRVALVGVGFGAEFAPIYRDHPDVEWVGIYDSNSDKLRAASERFCVSKTWSTLEEILDDDEVDAVHLVTPIPLHAQQSVAVLNAGKHCACTVPMATSFEDIQAIIRAQKTSGKNYMMMETAVYTREFLMVQDRFDKGDFGTISFARGGHMQDMEGWPYYWYGLPPHHYMTHAISPILRLLQTRVKKVHCFGSGALPEDRRQRYGNPFPVETAIFRLVDSDVAVEVTRSLFQTVRPYSESFAIYGEKLGFEWQQIEEEDPLVFSIPEPGSGRGRKILHEAVEPPDRQDLLPEEIAAHTRKAVFSDGKHLSFVQGGGHSGSHPHLVHEFVRSIVEGRPSSIDALTAAAWTAPGIAAHMSAMQDGEAVRVPDFRDVF
ncbi:gfo/Idh/MocA family oxidoreductase [Sinorhizobium meliloti]|nr:gfo/Idh/MocA family oxidoreductase [Sinorhizobium meliloti]MDW9750629.1 gfo/Idh/MocA family oxidoreductase [Sinorhizobium meliloti]MDX0359615.1 gfo/Idh/MocA family oxidoreductase [Sinorhizobium meliloti]